MRRRLRIFGTIAVLAAMALFVPANSSHAATVTVPSATSSTPVSRCNAYVGLANRVAMCVRGVVSYAAYRYFSGFYPLVQKAIAGFLTLTVAIFGVLAAFGMLEKAGRETFMLLIKLALVTWAVVNADTIYSVAIRLMDAAGGAVVEYTPGSGQSAGQHDFSQSICIRTMKQASGATPYSAPWLAMDCVVDSVIGIRMPVTTSGSMAEIAGGGVQKWFNDNLDPDKRGMARGMLYFFFVTMQSSVIGMIVAIVGFIFLYSLLFLVLKALFSFIAGYIGITFMLIFAPIFIPLVMFRKTAEYFNKWLKLCISFTLQPVIILVFIMFSIAAVDLAVFSGDYSIMYKLAGTASRQPGFNLNSYLETHAAVKKAPTKIADIKLTSESAGVEPDVIKGVAGKIVNSKCSEALQRTDPAAYEICKQSRPIQFWRDSIDWEKLEAVRSPAVRAVADHPGQQISREVLSAAIFAALVVFLMNGLLAVVPMVANDLVGESQMSPNLYSAISRRAGNGLDGLVNRVANGLRGGK